MSRVVWYCFFIFQYTQERSRFFFVLTHQHIFDALWFFLFFGFYYAFLSHTHTKSDFLDAILEGYLTLIDISLPHPKDGLIPQQPAQLMMNPQQTMNQTSTTPFATNSSYQGVTATFCHIAWDLQQRNPSLVPTFHDLQQQSMLCPGTMIHNVDLYSLVQQAKAYDDDLLPMHDARHRRYHQVVAQPTAVLFHETRCGSTLFSNLITASLPAQVRSYSESKPPLVALMACDLLSSSSSSSSSSSNPYRRPPVCNHESQLQLIRDVFYMMGRMARPQHPQYVFYKMQSIGVRYIHLLTTALPNVSWTFLFRDSVEILMSHFHEYQHQHSHIQKQQQQKQQSKTTTKKRKKGQDKEEEEDKQEKEQHYHDTPSLEEEPHFWKKSRNPSSARPVCLRSYGKHRQDPTLVQVVQTYAPGRNVSSLTPEEYCAAHLATLAQTAVTEYHYTMKDQEEQQQQQQLEGEDEEITKNLIAQFHRKQWFLSYPKLPHVIWERWLPVMLHMGAVSRDMKDRMQVMANVYSKTQGGSTTSSSRTSTQQQSWYEDSTLKQGRAPESLKKAAQLFLDPIYQTMTDIEASQQVH